jgi:hypothetical protein
VVRDENDEILAIYAEPQPGTEPIPIDDPELLAFASGADSEQAMRSYLANSDDDLLRIVEELITVLIDQNVVLLTDFPAGAQRKLLRRQSIREKLQTV